MWAILGTTKIAETMVAAIREAGDEVLSVYAPMNQERLLSFAERFNIPHRFQNIDQALSIDGINAVWIGTPNQTHAYFSLKAFAKDHIDIVLSEKSLERDMHGARLIEHALARTLVSRRERGINKPLIFREAIFYLNHPIIHKYYAFLRSGALGPVKAINTEYSRDLARFTNADGGGAIYSLGIYPVSLVHLSLAAASGDENLFSNRHVRAFAHIQTDKNCREEKNKQYVARSTALIQFAQDIKVSITACEIEQGEQSNHFEIIGTNGRVVFRTNPFSPAKFHNQFDFIDVNNNTTTFTAQSEIDAYTHQILMTKQDLIMQREIAARPTASFTDSMAMMALLTEWEKTAVDNAETVSDSLALLKARMARK